MKRKAAVKAGLYMLILLLWGCCSWKVSKTVVIERVWYSKEPVAVDSAKDD